MPVRCRTDRLSGGRCFLRVRAAGLGAGGRSHPDRSRKIEGDHADRADGSQRYPDQRPQSGIAEEPEDDGGVITRKGVNMRMPPHGDVREGQASPYLVGWSTARCGRSGPPLIVQA